MAQRIFIAKPTHQFKYTIGDDDLWLYEFQEFFEMLKYKYDFAIDGYSGAILNIEKNRIIAELFSKQIYIIEDSFPDVKQSKFNNKKQISKFATIRVFETILNILQEAYDLDSQIFINGE